MASTTAVRRCIKPSSTPISLFQRKYLSPISHFSPFVTTKRFYSSESKKNEPSDSVNNTNPSAGEQKNNTEQQPQQPNQTEQEQKQELKQEQEQKQEGQQEQKKEGQEKQEGQQEQKKEGEEKQEGQQEQKKEGEEKTEGEEKQEGQQKQEELPPWFASLPIWKKILYPSLLISFVSLMTELIYQSTLRSYLPYKKAMHVIGRVDEIEQAMGEIKEPRWYRFWEVLYGYSWEETGGYEGIAKFWIPIVGVTEHDTGELNKKGEPVTYKTYTRGRAYAEAKKVGAGGREWEIVYLVVKSPLLEKNSNSSEVLGVEAEGRVALSPSNKGEMVIIDKHVRMGNEF